MAAAEKKATDMVYLNMEKLTTFTDGFFICSGRNTIQTRSIADEIEEKMKLAGYHLHSREGYHEGNWILLDYKFIIIHVFIPTTREFYMLEKLWGDATVKIFE